MKLSKLFKIALPILGVATIATTVPLALTSCSSQTDSSNSTSKPGQGQQQVQVLEPVDINSLPVPIHNFKNSFTQQPTEITSLADANKQLQEKWNQMSESEKTQTLQNDLQNWANTYNQFTYFALPNQSMNGQGNTYSMLQFEPITPQISASINKFLVMQNDPRGQEAIPTTYKYRFFQDYKISDIQYNSNNQLSFSFITNNILQISDGTKVIAQINDCITANYQNFTIEPMLLKSSWMPKSNYASTFVLIKGNVSTTQEIKNIITNNSTPITDYFKNHINNTYVTSNDPSIRNEQIKSGFKLYKPATIQLNFQDLYNSCINCASYPTGSNTMPTISTCFSWMPDNYCSPTFDSPVAIVSPTLNVLDTLNTTSSGSPATTQNK